MKQNKVNLKITSRQIAVSAMLMDQVRADLQNRRRRDVRGMCYRRYL